MKDKKIAYSDLEVKVGIGLTRVSTSRQEYQGSSLKTQREEIERYALEHNIRIKYFMGDTHESAKTEGEIYKSVITAALSDPEVNVLIVHSIDRFSRNEEGLVARKILQDNGVYLISVTQPTNPDTPEGELLTKLNLVLAEYDNAVRRGKVLAGQYGQLHRGEWPYQIPIGYKRNPILRKEICIDEANGNLMKQAFLWRAEGVPQVVICERLKAMGLDMQPKHLSKLLKNPFYCGWIIHENLDNVPMKGIHPAIIDEETFFTINKEFRHRIYGTPEEWGYLDEIDNNEDRITKMEPKYPLKRLLHCPQCGKALTGYQTVRLSRVHHYYKCNTKGCCLNLNATDLHQQFEELINQYQLNPIFFSILKKILKDDVHTRFYEEVQNLPQLRKRYSEIEKQKETAQVKYAIGKISDDTYNKVLMQTEDSLKTLEEQIYVAEQAEGESIKMEQYVIDSSQNILDLIRQADYKDRLRLQFQIFPKGLIMNVEGGQITYKTEKLCPIYKKIA